MIDVDIMTSNLSDDISTQHNPEIHYLENVKETLFNYLGSDFISLYDTIKAIAIEKDITELGAAEFIFCLLKPNQSLDIFDLAAYEAEFNFDDPPILPRQHLTQYLRAIKEYDGLPDDIPDFIQHDKEKKRAITAKAFRGIGFRRIELENLLNFSLLSSEQRRELEKWRSRASYLLQDEDDTTQLILQSNVPEYEKAMLLKYKTIVKLGIKIGIEIGEDKSKAQIKELEKTIQELEQDQIKIQTQLEEVIQPKRYNPTERTTHLQIIAGLIYLVTGIGLNKSSLKYWRGLNINVLAICSDIIPAIEEMLYDPTTRARTIEGARRIIAEAMKMYPQIQLAS